MRFCANKTGLSPHTPHLAPCPWRSSIFFDWPFQGYFSVVVHLCASVDSYVAIVFVIFVPYLSFILLRDGGISCVSSLVFLWVLMSPHIINEYTQHIFPWRNKNTTNTFYLKTTPYPCYLELCFVCLFVLRFYGPVNPTGSCRARSVYLTTRLLGRLSPLSGSPVLCAFFRQKLTTALLESAEGREWP